MFKKKKWANVQQYWCCDKDKMIDSEYRCYIEEEAKFR